MAKAKSDAKTVPAAAPAASDSAASAAPGHAAHAADAPIVAVPAGSGERRLGESEKVAAVAALLAGKAPGGEEDAAHQDTAGDGGADGADAGAVPAADGDAGGEEDDAEGKPAEPVPDKRDAAFYAQTVRMADGSDVSVGELKDAWSARAQAELAMQQRESEMAEHLVEMERVLKFFEAIPGVMKYRGAEHYEAMVRRESAGLLEIYPAWRDEKARQADETEVLALAREYGREEAIRQELRNPSDRMVVKMLVDFARLRARVARAGAQLKAAQPTERPAARQVAVATVARQRDALVARAKATGRQADQLRAVNALLGSK